MNSANTVALDLAPLMSWIVAAMTVINFLILLKGLITSGEKKLEDRVLKVEAKLIEHDRRIQKMESDIGHMPDRETTHRIELTMVQIVARLDTQDANLSGRFSAMEERLKPIQAIGERLQDVLIEQAKSAA